MSWSSGPTPGRLPPGKAPLTVSSAGPRTLTAEACAAPANGAATAPAAAERRKLRLCMMVRSTSGWNVVMTAAHRGAACRGRSLALGDGKSSDAGVEDDDLDDDVAVVASVMPLVDELDDRLAGVEPQRVPRLRHHGQPAAEQVAGVDDRVLVHGQLHAGRDA